MGIHPSIMKPDTKTEDLDDPSVVFRDGRLVDQSGQLIRDDDSGMESLRFELLNVMTPEQTGRFGWPVDARSDLYSMGAVFYYWATGHYPFSAEDAIGYFHCHIARHPLPPETLNPEIPLPVSLIILKLLNKSPEKRYQSAAGVIEDLKICRTLEKDTPEYQTFKPGSFDIPLVFKISRKLYGRQQDMTVLSERFSQAQEGDGKVCFVSGYSGIGKTSLIKTFARQSIRETYTAPLYIYGRFESRDRNRPYQAIIQALEKLADLILSRDTLASWQSCLSQGLAGHGQIISRLAPAFERFSANARVNIEPDLVEARAGIIDGFIDFFKAVCAQGHPLILVLDDLQWADKATLNLLRAFMEHRIGRLFIIGAFRSDEIEQNHPLQTCLDHTKPEDIIPLTSLEKETVVRMITDSNRMKEEDARHLAHIAILKTRGNPFFLNNFLMSVYRDGLLRYDRKSSEWRFNETEILSRDVTRNVAALLAARINILSKIQKGILGMASCMARGFNSDLLSDLCRQPKTDIINSLIYLTSQGMLVMKDDTWYFSHDSIKDSLYDTLDKRQRARNHYLLANFFLARNTSSDNEVFEILQHFSRCTDRIRTHQKKILVARLNLKAGLAARKNLALESACFYAAAGIDILPPDSPESEPELWLSLSFLAGETGYYAAKTAFANNVLESVKEKAENSLDSVKACDLIMANLILEGKIDKARHTGLEALDLLGLRLPENVSSWSIIKELIRVRFSLFRRRPEDLKDLPKMTDPKKLMAVKIYTRLFEVSYLGAHEYIPLLVLKVLNLTLKYGENELSGYAYALYGAFLCERLERYDEGFQFGKLALAVHEQPNMLKTKARTYLIFGGMINPWKNNLETDFPYLLEAHEAGVKNGNDPMFAAIAMNQYLSQLMISGRSLEWVKKIFEKQIKFFKTVNPLSDNLIFNINYQTLLVITGRSDNSRMIKGPYFDESVDFEKIKRDNDASIRVFYMMKVVIHFLFYEWDSVVDAGRQGLDSLNKTIGVLMWPYFSFLMSASLLALYPDMNKKQRKSTLSTVRKHLKKLNRIAKESPENFSSMHLLLSAEIDGVTGRFEDAVVKYEQALSSADTGGLTHIKAIANECAARFFLKKRLKGMAAPHIRTAYHEFSKWGVRIKLKQLEKIYPEFLTGRESKSNLPTEESDEILPKSMGQPDLVSILKASGAISREMDIQPLMDKLMEIVIENAGARRGFLVLLKKGLPRVEAVIFSEPQEHQVKTHVPPEDCPDLPSSIVHYVIQTGKIVLLEDASMQGQFIGDTQLKKIRAKSVLCLPMIHDGRITGALYLDNNLSTHVFTGERVTVLKLVADILTNAWSRKKAQEDLMLYQDKLRALSSRISLAEEQERRKIAQGLHDRIGQSLVLSKMKLSQLQQVSDSTEAKKKIQDLIKIAARTIEQTRSLTFDLSSPELYLFGLEHALDSLSERYSGRYDLAIDFYDDQKNKPLDESARILLYQSVRELLFNIIKHAHAQKAGISIILEKGDICIQVRDDGVGFNPSELENNARNSVGFGLFSIKERMQHHNGSFSIESAPEKGTLVTLRVPLA